jgi:hypothetical protein
VQKGTHCDLGRIVAAVDGNPLASVASAAASLRMAVRVGALTLFQPDDLKQTKTP